MAAYAPYENVGRQRYPPILAETSLNDTRVLYVEPAKWVRPAARHRPTGGADVLLKHRDGRRARRGLRALQVLARPGVHAGLDPGPDGPRRDALSRAADA